ncbi:MAG: extracellular solute-binding protein [Lachnospiraceae bacterium]|nr:extracellular solute-binding protein [Lachnospiraceae bacterium]
MKKNLKRTLSLGLAAMMALGVTACGGSSTDSAATTAEAAATEAAKEEAKESAAPAAEASGDVKVIKLFHRFPDDPCNSFIESKIAEYEAAHPDIKFEVTSAQNQPYKEKIKVVVGSDECPDIFFSFCGEFSERFIREGLLLDLTPYLEADKEWKDSLMETQMTEYTTADGMVYGIPFRLDAKEFFYNVDMFNELGLEVPETWDQFIEVLDKIQAAGITPIAEGNQDKWPACHYIGALNEQLVADDVRAKDYNAKTGEFTDPGYVEALEKYQQLVSYMNMGVNGMTHDMARLGFTQGQNAILFAELVEITNLKQENPDLNWGMFKFPVIEGAKGNPDLVSGAPEGFAVSSKTKYPDECVEFLKWFLGSEVGAQQAEQVGWFNASKGVDEGLTDPSLISAYEVIANAKKMDIWFDNALYSTVCDEYLTQISDVTNGDISPADAMAKIQKVAKEAQSLVQ